MEKEEKKHKKGENKVATVEEKRGFILIKFHKTIASMMAFLAP